MRLQPSARRPGARPVVRRFGLAPVARVTGLAFGSQARPSTPTESSSPRRPARDRLCFGRVVPVPVLSTPPCGDAVPVRYRTALHRTGADLHRSIPSPSQAHGRGRLGRSGPCLRGPHRARGEQMVWCVAARSSSARGRAEPQPGRLCSPSFNFIVPYRVTGVVHQLWRSFPDHCAVGLVDNSAGTPAGLGLVFPAAWRPAPIRMNRSTRLTSFSQALDRSRSPRRGHASSGAAANGSHDTTCAPLLSNKKN